MAELAIRPTSERAHLELVPAPSESSELIGKPVFEQQLLERPEGELAAILETFSDAPLTHGNHIEILEKSEDIFGSIFEAVENAQDHIHISTYTFNDGQISHQLLDTLVRKASEGVKVRLLLDFWGSKDLWWHGVDQDIINRLLECQRLTGNFEVRWFNPFKVSQIPLLTFIPDENRTDHRNHTKIMVVDDKYSFTGGVGFSDEWLGLDRASTEEKRDPEAFRKNHYRDTHIKIEGPATQYVQKEFLKSWVQGLTDIDFKTFAPPKPVQKGFIGNILSSKGAQAIGGLLSTAASLLEVSKKGKAVDESYGSYLHYFHEQPEFSDGVSAQVIANRPFTEETAKDLFIHAIDHAEGRLWITTGFFNPPPEYQDALIRAKERGVDVRIIIPGMHSFHPGQRLAYRAGKYAFENLLKRGVRIFEYKYAIHAKQTLNNNWAIVGSSNYDWRSHAINDEMNVIIYDKSKADQLARTFETDQAESVELTLGQVRADFDARDRLQRYRDGAAYFFRRTL